MSRFKKILKWSLITVAGIIVVLLCFSWWFIRLLNDTDTNSENLKTAIPASLTYLTEHPVQLRGKILAVVTNTGKFSGTNKKTGYELSELSQAYYVFLANGFQVDIASPLGGEAPMVRDDDDMGVYDFAFLNDTLVQRKLNTTLAMDRVRLTDYVAIYFVGGKGVMFDFPDNASIQQAVKQFYEQGKVIGAICHGPAAFVNVKLTDGTPFLKGKKVCSFTNQEELFLIKNARELFPFLLQDKLIASGAEYNEGALYLENVTVDGNLITGQNPWSTWSTAEAMIQQLGYDPKKRQKTPTENAVQILNTYHEKGYDDARLLIERVIQEDKKSIDKNLMGMHAIIAGMQGKLGQGLHLIGLLQYAKSLSLKKD